MKLINLFIGFFFFLGCASELMLLGFISLLLTVGQGVISDICISEKVGSTWHPCNKKQEEKTNEDVEDTDYENRRRLLTVSDSGGVFRRSLAGASEDKCAAKVRPIYACVYMVHAPFILRLYSLNLRTLHFCSSLYKLTIIPLNLQIGKVHVTSDDLIPFSL